MKANETISYQGRQIAVQCISEVNTRIADGMDLLLRDEEGTYYLQRELYDEDAGCFRARRSPQECHYRRYVHRISLAGAILWQTDFASARIMRLDAGALLRSVRQARE